MTHFISCDWGTSSFRLRLVETTSLSVIASITSSQGIAITHGNWQLQQDISRIDYFNNYILFQLQLLQEQSTVLLQNLTIVISGMISSALGMMELPYKRIPFLVTAAELPVHSVEATEKMPHRLMIISGICSADDVMRGEETIVAGCMEDACIDRLFILPGTHSKHVIVKGASIVDIATYMTGELFSLLVSKSVLAGSVEVNEDIIAGNFFHMGLHNAGNTSLLHTIFQVRTNTLLKGISKQDNYAFLSGLLIGEELVQLAGETRQIALVSSGRLMELYKKALSVLLPGRAVHDINADNALVKAHAAIFLHYQ